MAVKPRVMAIEVDEVTGKEFNEARKDATKLMADRPFGFVRRGGVGQRTAYFVHEGKYYRGDMFDYQPSDFGNMVLREVQTTQKVILDYNENPTVIDMRKKRQA